MEILRIFILPPLEVEDEVLRVLFTVLELLMYILN